MIPGQAPANVRFAPNSGRKWVTGFMSAYDPKRTLVVMLDGYPDSQPKQTKEKPSWA